MSGIVQFRVSDEDIAYVKSKGLNPNDLARDRWIGYLQGMHLQDMAELMRKNPPAEKIDAAKAIRDARRELEDRY